MLQMDMNAAVFILHELVYMSCPSGGDELGNSCSSDGQLKESINLDILLVSF